MPSFNWKEVPSTSFGATSIPVAGVRFKDVSGSWKALELVVDSGALVSLVKRSFGDLLGLKLSEGEPIELAGIKKGAKVHAYVHRLPIKIGSVEMSARVAFGKDDQVPNLLGRLDLFPRFDILLSQADGVTRLDPRGEA